MIFSNSNTRNNESSKEYSSDKGYLMQDNRKFVKNEEMLVINNITTKRSIVNGKYIIKADKSKSKISLIKKLEKC